MAIAVKITNNIDMNGFTINDPSFTGTITGLTSSDVGLGNVTNESKATMFTNPTFTGASVTLSTTSGGAGVNDIKFVYDATEYYSLNVDNEVFAVTDSVGATDVLILDNTISEIGLGWNLELNNNSINGVSTIEVNTINNSGGNLTLSTFGSPRLVLGGASESNFMNIQSVSINSTQPQTSHCFTLNQSGTGGGNSNIYVGTSTPEGSVTANGGDLFIQDSAGTSTIYVKQGDASNTGWLDLTITGTGDLLAANNLSDVANATTSFNNIKQSATTTFQGVVEIATQTEVNTGTDTTRPVTPSTLANSTLASNVATNNAKVGVTTEISNVVEDTTPQLGGNLDVNGNEITSVGGNDITLHSDDNIVTRLGDAAGVSKLSIEDSSNAEVSYIDSDGLISTLGDFQLDGNGTRRTLFSESQLAPNKSSLQISQRTGGGISQGTLDIELDGAANFCSLSTDRTNGFLFDKDITTATGTITSSTDMTLRTGGSTTVMTLSSSEIDALQDVDMNSNDVKNVNMMVLDTFTTGTLPTPVAGGVIYVSDGANGDPTISWSDGTDWYFYDATVTAM